MGLDNNDLNVPYEELPDGPFDTEIGTLLASGITITSCIVEADDGAVLQPALTFRFADGAGKFFPPMTLVLEDSAMKGLDRLVTNSVRSVLRAVNLRRREQRRGNAS